MTHYPNGNIDNSTQMILNNLFSDINNYNVQKVNKKVDNGSLGPPPEFDHLVVVDHLHHLLLEHPDLPSVPILHTQGVTRPWHGDHHLASFSDQLPVMETTRPADHQIQITWR